MRKLNNYIEKSEIKGHELKGLKGLVIICILFYIIYGLSVVANLDAHTSFMELYKFIEDRGFKVAKMMPKGL